MYVGLQIVSSRVSYVTTFDDRLLIHHYSNVGGYYFLHALELSGEEVARMYCVTNSNGRLYEYSRTTNI